MNSHQHKMRWISKGIAIAIFLLMIILVLTILNSIHFALKGANFYKMNSLLITSFPTAKLLFNKQNLIPLTVAVVLYQAVILAILFLIYRIFRDISSEYTPFKQIHVARLKWIAGLSIAMGICSYFVVFAAGAAVISASLQFNLDMFIPSVMIYCVALILDYGCSLQKQADETL